jgi:hypothetical protein
VEAKLFEVRDRMTTIPVLAVRLATRDEQERVLLARAGYYGDPVEPDNPRGYVVLWRLEGGDATWDPNNWGGGARTVPVAHEFITVNWRDLPTGAVVDVEYVLGEVKAPKRSEREEVRT